MTNPPVRVVLPSELSATQVAALAGLWFTVWPRDHATLEARIADFHERSTIRPERRLHTIFEDGQIVAVAESFAREIHTREGPLRVMALASVCTDPTRRGQGHGRAVVRSAFARVDAGAFPLALFQTGVAPFYEQLGGRLVKNPFSNARNRSAPATNPFWDPHVMIYPATAPWPEGPIDLNGPGY